MKKIIILIIISILIICIGMGGFYFIKNKKEQTAQLEYEPQEEISEEQERQTMVSLYFINKTTGVLEPEARLIDVKELINDPYTTLINLLIEGPKNDNHDKTIPDGTTLINCSLEGDVLKLDFSSEFINNHIGGREEEQNTIDSIVNTLTELSEVNSIKVLINGEENKSFKDSQIDFIQNFVRKE